MDRAILLAYMPMHLILPHQTMFPNGEDANKHGEK